MNHYSKKKLALAGAFAAAMLTASSMSMTTQAIAAPRAGNVDELALSVGRGRLITLPRPMADVFVANDKVADVQVRSSTQLYVFAKTPGETSVYATDAAGKVVYSNIVRVANNLETLDQMLGLAMPNSNIMINSMNGFVLLTGTVASPEDAAEADRLVQAMVGADTKVISRLQTATPLQVNLQVRIAEVSKTVLKDIGVQWRAQDGAGVGDKFRFFGNFSSDGATALGGSGKLLGALVNAQLNLAERDGLVTTLAQPNLTTMSGETADFLAGGEFPIPVAQSGGTNNTITFEFRKYGVSLSYTPTVLSNGRISMRVRPEVSELTSEGALKLGGYDVPGLSIRRTETTVELGSGESFMIAGLLSNRAVSSVNKTPGLGDVPIIGNLFKSDSFRRGETELVIMITPYLVKPVSADQIKLPTDAYQAPDDAQRIFMNKTSDGVSNASRPLPRVESNTVSGAPVRRGSSRPTTPDGPGFSAN